MTRSLRIALVVNPFTLVRAGGGHAPALARELLGRGHTVRGFGAPPRVIPRSGNVQGLDGVGDEPGPGLLGFEPEVIVAYDALSPAAWHSARVARRLRVPLVLVEEGFPRIGRPFQRFLRVVGERLWGRYVRRTAAAVVARDPVAREQVLSRGFPPGDVTILPTGVDLTHHRPGLTSHLPTRHGIRGRILLHLGQIEDGRGLELLIESFAATVGRREDWSLVFAGEGRARNRLRALADRLGIGSRVHWIGRPRNEELPGLMGACTLMIVPALDDEVAAVKVTRALACGLPVIASDVRRLAHLVQHDRCGLLVPAGDRDAWKQALQAAAGSPERRKRWRVGAREVAQESFAWPRVAERFEAMLLGTLQAPADVAEQERDEPLAEGEPLPTPDTPGIGAESGD